MKKNYALIFFIVFLFFTKASAQNYNNIVNFNFNNSITNGMKITTTLPFTGSSEMPTIEIKGYNYGAYKSIGLIISYYIYSVNGVLTFIDCSVSSFGGYTPSVSLSNENGYVVIFINDKPYFPRFTVSAFAQGMSADISSSYTGWTVTDAGLSGTATATTILPYINSFAGNVYMQGGIWNASGNVGIGTVNPCSYKLAVRGNIHAQQVNVDLNS